MKTLEEIRCVIARHKAELEEGYKVKQLGVFGSYVRGEQARKSDIDILVEFSGPIGLLKFIELEEFLKDLLGLKVDLVTRGALKPRIGERILKEVTYL